MKNIFVLFLSLFLSIALYSQEKNYSMDELKKTLQELKDYYAPDKRVAIFNINVNENGDDLVLSGETNLPGVKERLFPELVKTNLIDSIELLPSKELGENIYGVVNLSVANARSKPGHSEELSTQALLGTPIKVYKKKGGWYLVQTPDDYLGWMDDDGLALMDQEQLNNWRSSEKIIYIKRYGFAYKEKDINSLPVSDLTEGNILKKISAESDFIKIEFPDGRTGFIPSEDGMEYKQWLSNLNPTDNAIINKAMTFMGIPYLWGALPLKELTAAVLLKLFFT